MHNLSLAQFNRVLSKTVEGLLVQHSPLNQKWLGKLIWKYIKLNMRGEAYSDEFVKAYNLVNGTIGRKQFNIGVNNLSAFPSYAPKKPQATIPNPSTPAPAPGFTNPVPGKIKIPSLSEIRELAKKHGWKEIALVKIPPCIRFERDDVKMNIYHTTMTVQTAMNHPTKGKTQLNRKAVFYSELEAIFALPRTHTGKGYYQSISK